MLFFRAVLAGLCVMTTAVVALPPCPVCICPESDAPAGEGIYKGCVYLAGFE